MIFLNILSLTQAFNSKITIVNEIIKTLLKYKYSKTSRPLENIKLERMQIAKFTWEINQQQKCFQPVLMTSNDSK